MTAAGYANIKVDKFMVPIGLWPEDPKMKEIGLWMWWNIVDGLEGFCLRSFRKHLDMTLTELDKLLNKVHQELKNPNIHAYLEL